MNRRTFVQTALLAGLAAAGRAAPDRPLRLLLRSSWQTVNIGDIAHTPGLLAALEQQRPDAEVTLWPNALTAEVEALLRARFPRLRLARTEAERARALDDCDFFLHGSGPGLVGIKELQRARAAGRPYGIAGITLSDAEIAEHRAVLADAQFVFLRDSDSLRAAQAAGLAGPRVAFGPDATFAIDLRDEHAADALLARYRLEPGRFLCAIPRLRWTPYWEIHPGTRPFHAEHAAENAAHAEADHAKLRAGLVAWVRETGMRVLLAPEMTHEVALLRPLLYDPLPADVKPQVEVLDRYWLTAEACSVYARAAALASLEQHSPIMGIAAGVPALLLRQPTDTRKGRMWYDLGLSEWVFEIEQATGEQIAAALLRIAHDPPAARATAEQARTRAQTHLKAMIAALP